MRIPFRVLSLATAVLLAAACGEGGGFVVGAGAGGALVVSVTQDGAPLADVGVSVTGPLNRSGTTSASGIARFENLSEGTYVATISGFPSNVVFPTLTDTAVVSGVTPTTLTFPGTLLP